MVLQLVSIGLVVKKKKVDMYSPNVATIEAGLARYTAVISECDAVLTNCKCSVHCCAGEN